MEEKSPKRSPYSSLGALINASELVRHALKIVLDLNAAELLKQSKAYEEPTAAIEKK